jgi:hypothetical protein
MASGAPSAAILIRGCASTIGLSGRSFNINRKLFC